MQITSQTDEENKKIINLQWIRKYILIFYIICLFFIGSRLHTFMFCLWRILLGEKIILYSYIKYLVIAKWKRHCYLFGISLLRQKAGRELTPLQSKTWRKVGTRQEKEKERKRRTVVKCKTIECSEKKQVKPDKYKLLLKKRHSNRSHPCVGRFIQTEW